MTTALLVVDLDSQERSLSRLLLTADGRAASVLGLVSLPNSIVMLWLELEPTRVPHVVAAVSRLIGVRGVARSVEAPQVRACKHRVHVTEVVDVSVEFALHGVRRTGAGNGLTLMSATRQAVGHGTGRPLPSSEGWLTTHPISGQAVAVVRGHGFTLHAVGATPEAAALSVTLATADADHCARDEGGLNTTRSWKSQVSAPVG